MTTGSGDSTVTYYVADVVLDDATTLQSAFANDSFGENIGVVFRDEGARQGLAFYRDGTVKVYDETTTTAEELLADGVWNTLSFGPSLLDNGEVAAGIEDVEVDTNFGNHSIQGEQPRTAVGIIGENHLVHCPARPPGWAWDWASSVSCPSSGSAPPSWRSTRWPTTSQPWPWA